MKTPTPLSILFIQHSAPTGSPSTLSLAVNLYLHANLQASYCLWRCTNETRTGNSCLLLWDITMLICNTGLAIWNRLLLTSFPSTRMGLLERFLRAMCSTARFWRGGARLPWWSWWCCGNVPHLSEINLLPREHLIPHPLHITSFGLKTVIRVYNIINIFWLRKK